MRDCIGFNGVAYIHKLQMCEKLKVGSIDMDHPVTYNSKVLEFLFPVPCKSTMFTDDGLKFKDYNQAIHNLDYKHLEMAVSCAHTYWCDQIDIFQSKKQEHYALAVKERRLKRPSPALIRSHMDDGKEMMHIQNDMIRYAHLCMTIYKELVK